MRFRKFDSSYVNHKTKRALWAVVLCVGFFACATPQDAQDNIDLSIKKRGKDFGNCFEKWVPSKRSVEESALIVTFYIENDGSVTREKIKKSELQSPVVERCVLNVIKSIRFQPNTDPSGLSVDYPFTVSASGSVPTRRSDQIL